MLSSISWNHRLVLQMCIACRCTQQFLANHSLFIKFPHVVGPQEQRLVAMTEYHDMILWITCSAFNQNVSYFPKNFNLEFATNQDRNCVWYWLFCQPAMWLSELCGIRTLWIKDFQAISMVFPYWISKKATVVIIGVRTSLVWCTRRMTCYYPKQVRRPGS